LIKIEVRYFRKIVMPIKYATGYIRGDLMSVQSMLQTGLQAHKAGQFDLALNVYNTILKQIPNHPDALNLRGMLLLAREKYEEARADLKLAVATDPNHAFLWINYCNALVGCLEDKQALAAAEKALALAPDFLPAHLALAKVADRLKLYDQATKHACFVLEREEHPAALGIYGRAIAYDARRRGDNKTLAEAVAVLQKAMLQSRDPIDMVTQAAALSWLDKNEEALAVLQDLQAQLPDLEAFGLPRNELFMQIKLVEASILEQKGENAAAATILSKLWRHTENDMRPLYPLVGLLVGARELTRALALLDEAWELGQDDAKYLAQRAAVYFSMGRTEQSIPLLEKSLQHDPKNQMAWSTYLLCTINSSTVDIAHMRKAYHDFGATLEADFKDEWGNYSNTKDPDRKLRIGYLSSNLRQHVLADNMLPVFEKHDKSRYEIFVYNNEPKTDAMTERMQKNVDHWLQIESMEEQFVIDRIRADQIDILVHCMGHWSGNRISICAHKPAPIQVFYLCQCPSSGMRAFDYIIADKWLNEDNKLQDFCTETVVELPGGFQTTRIEDASFYTPPPCHENGYVTFASFNNVAKISSRCIRIWADAVNAVPNSRLMIKGFSPRGAEAAEQSYFSERFAAAGLDPARIDFIGWVPDFMAALTKADIMLDSYPFNGGRTTERALWMGVPVLTLKDAPVHSRFGYGLHCRVGIPELVAESDAAFVQKAAALAADPARLDNYRRTLPDMIKNCDTFNEERHLRELENAYRTMWHTWCETHS
jgi:predicted O-linked N-acetylglucosamine transferase (SPINDLY family)